MGRNYIACILEVWRVFFFFTGDHWASARGREVAVAVNRLTIFWWPVPLWSLISRFNTNWEEKLSGRRRCHTNLAGVQNAICLDGVGHDGDSPNAASSDAANPNCPCKPDDLRSEPCWRK